MAKCYCGGNGVAIRKDKYGVNRWMCSRCVLTRSKQIVKEIPMVNGTTFSVEVPEVDPPSIFDLPLKNENKKEKNKNKKNDREAT